MRKGSTRTVLLLAALAGLLLVVFAWRAFGPERRVTEGARMPAVVEPALVEPDSPSSAVDDPPPRTPEAPSAAAAEPASLPAGTTPFEVQIVRAGTREPVAGAEIWCWPRSAPSIGSDDPSAWLLAGRIEEHPPTAETARSDEQGRARVGRGSHGCSVVAFTESSWGSASFGVVSTGEACVVLHPDADLRVRVVDARGAPVAGVPVRLQEQRGRQRFDQVFATTEGAGGLARLRHAGSILNGRRDPDARFVVAVHGLFDPPVELQVESVATGADPVQLVLRPYGSCSVVVESAGGERFSGPFEAQLGFAPDTSSTPVPDLGGDTASILASGSAPIEFDFVELGHSLLAVVRRSGSQTVWVARGAGPTEPSQRVELRARPTGELAVLCGRVVDEGGAPLPRARLDAHLEAPDSGEIAASSCTLETGGDGRFALEAEPRPEAIDGAQLVLVLASRTNVAGAVAHRTLPDELPAGRIELGDIVLRSAPPLAKGVVVDEPGHPIAGATVLPVETQVEAGSRDPASHLEPVESDADGRFELRGARATDTLWLRAEKSGLASDPVRVRGALEPVRLVLTRTGSIEGTVLADPRLLEALLLVETTREPSSDGLDAPASAHTAVLGRDGHFACDGLRAGSYALRVIYAPTASELASVEGVVVRAGEATRDGRLAPLDLRGKFGWIELELVDPAGQPIPGGRALSCPSGSTGTPWTYARHEGARLSILSDGGPVDVSIDAEGFVSLEIASLSASRTVTLERAARLRFELARDLVAPEPPLRLVVQIETATSRTAPLLARPVRAPFGPGGVAECECPFVGDVLVQVLVEHPDAALGAPVPVRNDAPYVLRVAPHALEQTFTLRVDPGRLAEAIGAARNDH